MNATVEKVRRVASEIRVNSEIEYRALVESLATGEDLDADSVLEFVAAAGKTVEDLDRDVRVVAERLRLVKLLEREPEAQREHAAAIEAVEVAARERDAAIVAHNQKIANLNVAVATAQAKLRESKAARQALRNGARPELKSRLEALNGRRAELEENLHRHRNEITRLEKIAERPVPKSRDENLWPYPSVIDAERGRRAEAKLISDAQSSHTYATDGIAMTKQLVAKAEEELRIIEAQVVTISAQMLAP